MCVRAMNGLARSGLITMDDASCISSTEAGRLMSVFYLDLETMKLIMKIGGEETLEQLLSIICESHELADMHLRVDERRCLNALNRNQAAATIRFPMKGKINSRQMKLSCIIQAVLGCLPIAEPSLNQEAMKIMRTANRICKCLVAYVTRPELLSGQSHYFSAVLNSIILAKCIEAHLWENTPYVSKQLKGIGPTFSSLLATAGKVKFMLVEESHPRDLERIMNKAPPAGNILKKQISLLPKYQLDATPINEKTVSIRLLLLNRTHLSENMDELTAGESHKCFVIAGDSKNYILLLNSFTDRDLISVYDGTMTFEITRKHNSEHKISLHCISSTFVGIDAHCEYTFTNLMPSVQKGIAPSNFTMVNDTPRKQVAKIQPKERKRKNTDVEITQSSEKKKRENALAEKFRLLKESFSKASNQIKNELQKTEKKSKNALYGLVHTEGFVGLPDCIPPKETNDDVLVELNDLENNFKDVDFEAFVDDEKFDSILNNIETEIKVNNQDSISTNTTCGNKNLMKFAPSFGVNRKRNSTPKDKNYEFIDLLDRNVDVSDNDEKRTNENGFSAAIKTQLDKYLQNSRFASKTPDPTFIELLDGQDIETQQYNKGIKINSTKKQFNHFEKINDIEISNDVLCIELHTNKKPLEYNLNLSETNHNISPMPIMTDHSKGNQNQKSVAHLDIHSKNSLNEILMHKENLQKPIDEVQNTIERNEFLGADDLCENKLVAFSRHNMQSIKNENLSQMTEKVMDDKHELIRRTGFWQNKQKLLVASSHDNMQLIPTENFNRSTDKKGLQTRGYETTNKSNETKELMQIPFNYLSQQSSPKSEINQIEHYIPHTSTSLPENSNEFKSNRLFKQAIGSSQYFTAPNNVYNRNKPQYDENNGTKKLENKYTFSAEKLDVHSKFTPYHEIRITRKFKIDVDITETVLEENLKPTSGAKINKDCAISNENNKVAAESLNKFNVLERTNNLDNNLIKIMEEQKNELMPEKNIDTFDKKSNRATTVNEAIKESEQHYHHHKELKYSYEKVKEQEGKKLVNRHDLKSEGANNTFSEMTRSELECQQPNESNANSSIENILQKYGKILSNAENNIKLTTTPKTTIHNNNNKKRPIKSNKPFKITDIQSIDVQLNNVCDVPRSTSNQVLNMDANTSEKPRLHEEVLKPSNQDEEPTKAGYLKQAHVISLSADNHNNDDDYSQCSPVVLTEANDLIDVIDDQFNLDYTLLNPKMFLQCYNNDDHNNIEVIPPPPEFSDHATVYSPKIVEDIDNNYSYNNFDIDLNYNTVHEDYPMNNSIFEDNTNKGEVVDLTPNKEVETWNLSIDDDLVNNSLSNIRQCRTVLFRTNTDNNTDNNCLYLNFPFGYNRQGKLTQFKFNHKSKLKRRI